MRIHQLSASYEAVQDRILLRINTHEAQELELWLTRRLLGQLFPVLLAYEAELALQSAAAQNPAKAQAHSPEARQMLADIKREEVLGRSDFASPYQAPKAHAAPTHAPFLVTQVQIDATDLAEGQIRLQIEELLQEGGKARSLKLNFPASVYIGLIALLQRTLALSGWNEIGGGIPPPATSDAADNAPLHLW